MRKKLKYVLACIWVAAVTVFVGVLHSWHKADYSQNLVNGALSNSYQKLFSGEFGVMHFLAPTCSCSDVILNTFMETGPLKNGVMEEIHLVGDDLGFRQKLIELGYKVYSYTFTSLADAFQGQVAGLPLLIIYDDQKNTIYQGGYSESSITPFTKIDIAQFLSTVKQGEQKKLPVIGCAVSRELQKRIDILGIKYPKGSP